MKEDIGKTKPICEYPMHCVDKWHEPERGDDRFGTRPQLGVTLLQAEMSGLSYRNGYETAWDDVSNENIVPKVVHGARAVEMDDFEKTWGVRPSSSVAPARGGRQNN